MVIHQSKRLLSVLMNDVVVGCLEKTKQGGLLFYYTQDWLNTPGARPISLSLPLIAQSFSGDVVYHFFDNLLPDNARIKARIQAKFRITSDHPFDLLACIGKDCVGAIQLLDGDIPPFKKEINAELLSQEKMAGILRNYQNNPLGMTDDESEFRISIAGAQEKTAFLYHEKQWYRPLGSTPTSHIFKLPIGTVPQSGIDLSDSCENEWLCAQIIESFGLTIAPCQILLFEEMKVLSVERFDRKLSSDGSWLMRLPQEDMCQALGISSHLKYQSNGGPGIKDLMTLLLGSSQAALDRETFYRAQILFWMLAGLDGHAKNFSLFIEPQGKYRLTPLYDVISAYPLIARRQLDSKKIKMAMALKGKNMHYHWHDLQRRYFIETAKAAHYSNEIVETLLDEIIEKTDSVIEAVSLKLPKEFPVVISQSILEGLKRSSEKLKR